MLEKKYRLTKKEDFDETLKEVSKQIEKKVSTKSKKEDAKITKKK